VVHATNPVPPGNGQQFRVPALDPDDSNPTSSSLLPSSFDILPLQNPNSPEAE
jgi:hypothetical protein